MWTTPPPRSCPTRVTERTCGYAASPERCSSCRTDLALDKPHRSCSRALFGRRAAAGAAPSRAAAAGAAHRPAADRLRRGMVDDPDLDWRAVARPRRARRRSRPKKAGRLKANGHLLRRSPLSDLVELAGETVHRLVQQTLSWTTSTGSPGSARCSGRLVLPTGPTRLEKATYGRQHWSRAHGEVRRVKDDARSGPQVWSGQPRLRQSLSCSTTVCGCLQRVRLSLPL